MVLGAVSRRPSCASSAFSHNEHTSLSSCNGKKPISRSNKVGFLQRQSALSLRSSHIRTANLLRSVASLMVTICPTGLRQWKASALQGTATRNCSAFFWRHAVLRNALIIQFLVFVLVIHPWHLRRCIPLLLCRLCVASNAQMEAEAHLVIDLMSFFVVLD